MSEPRYIDKGATFSPDRKYRYRLWRTWNPTVVKKPVMFVMLNPSTADERVLDPTVRRCLGYAMDWGYGRMDVCNIFALRSTDPKALYGSDDPVGRDNDQVIRATAAESDLVIAAWGIHGQHQNRSSEIFELFKGLQKPLYCLSMTRSGGQPGHPLYLRKDLKPQEIRM